MTSLPGLHNDECTYYCLTEMAKISRIDTNISKSSDQEIWIIINCTAVSEFISRKQNIPVLMVGGLVVQDFTRVTAKPANAYETNILPECLKATS